MSGKESCEIMTRKGEFVEQRAQNINAQFCTKMDGFTSLATSYRSKDVNENTFGDLNEPDKPNRKV